MWTAKWILDAYAEGSEAVRFQMYLVYPDLRMYFDEIDLRPAGAVEAGQGDERESPSEAWWSYWCRMAKS